MMIIRCIGVTLNSHTFARLKSYVFRCTERFPTLVQDPFIPCTFQHPQLHFALISFAGNLNSSYFPQESVLQADTSTPKINELMFVVDSFGLSAFSRSRHWFVDEACYGMGLSWFKQGALFSTIPLLNTYLSKIVRPKVKVSILAPFILTFSWLDGGNYLFSSFPSSSFLLRRKGCMWHLSMPFCDGLDIVVAIARVASLIFHHFSSSFWLAWDALLIMGWVR